MQEAEIKLTEREQKLTQEIVSRLRKIEHGEVPITIFVKNYEPIRFKVKGAEESVMLV